MTDRQPDSSRRAESLCRYTRLDNGIHKLTIVRSSRLAADDWSGHISHIVEGQTSASPIVRILVDSAVGVLPLGYVSSKVRELMRKHPNPPRIRYAVLMTSLGLAGLVDTFVRALHISSVKLRSFPIHQEAEAVAWLISDE